MPRIRTESAIKKSLITPEQKAENRKNNRAKANRQYRLRKGRVLKEKERRRMMELALSRLFINTGS
ncbi:hypothetical protein BT96DRAFT_1010077 [Gymnopus androsaceus JB14]|uniref:Uncharacterized protein n=1 Tax=Gymnopus androsaceus JB14 TaxID=1447944 RepID=A0A6A4GBG7_9AGAR|nr:hypothetical protein BT96DRAFT_1010077 [Gymnopus androsaceus JB14]